MVDWSLTLPTAGALSAAARALIPPIIEFGGPAQRSKRATESFWHIPTKIHPRVLRRIGPASIPNCRAFLDIYVRGSRLNSLQLCWGDMLFVDPVHFELLRANHVSLVPVAWRDEREGSCFFTDARFLRNPSERVHPIPVGKSRIKLRIKSGRFERESPHFYLVRCPEGKATNGLFTVEIEYEGEGTAETTPSHLSAGPSPPRTSEIEAVPKAPAATALSLDQKDRRLRALDKFRGKITSIHPLINRMERLQSQAWNAFVASQGLEYTNELRDLRDSFASALRELNTIRDQYLEYNDIVAALRMEDGEKWIGAMGEYLVTCQALFTYLKPDVSQDVFDNLTKHALEGFLEATSGYIRWHGYARACIDQFLREVAI